MDITESTSFMKRGKENHKDNFVCKIFKTDMFQ